MVDFLTTDRLVLRAVQPSDLADVIDVQGDPEANRNPQTSVESVALLEGWRVHWAANGFGYWAIDLAETGEHIGFGGLQHTEHDGEHYLNVYYRLRPRAWGRGYAPEMVRAALAWAKRALPGQLVRIVTAVDNEPAIRVALKLGFTEVKRADYHGTASVFYDHLDGNGVGT